MNSLFVTLASQQGLSDQLQIWGMDLWNWIFDSAINPALHGTVMVVGGIIGSGAILGVGTLYTILNENE